MSRQRIELPRFELAHQCQEEAGVFRGLACISFLRAQRLEHAHRHPWVRRPLSDAAWRRPRPRSCRVVQRCPPTSMLTAMQKNITDGRAQLTGLLLPSSARDGPPRPAPPRSWPSPLERLILPRLASLLGSSPPLVGAWSGGFAFLLGARLAVPQLRLRHRSILGSDEELARQSIKELCRCKSLGLAVFQAKKSDRSNMFLLYSIIMTDEGGSAPAALTCGCKQGRNGELAVASGCVLRVMRRWHVPSRVSSTHWEGSSSVDSSDGVATVRGGRTSPASDCGHVRVGSQLVCRACPW